MPSDPIYVDNTLFLGRVEEQKQFRAALNEVLAAPPDEDLPYVLLLFGDGGMGKTTLAKRFRDIAQCEPPFEGEFQVLWVDWEDERRRYAALLGGREHVSPETVFDVIHADAVNAKWGASFGAYQEAVKERGKAEKKAAEALSAGGERDDLAAVRGAGAGAIAKVLRVSLPIGETGEKVAKVFLDAGIKVGAEQAAQLRAALETRLRARLDPKQFDLFLNPNDQLARALAEGLKKIAASKPLLLFLDTYEIVDRADLWLRVAMRAAGPRVAWIVGGRDNLVQSRQFDAGYFKGYADDFPRRLLPYDMRQLAEQDIRALFADRAPDRALDEASIDAISRATRGVPLALDEAAEMWAKGLTLADIAGDMDAATPRGQIVQKMSARYFLHVPETDKPALYALALARGDIEILRAMLRPAEATPFNLDTLLRRLERDYASVHYEHARLHDEPAFFLRAYLKEEIHRTGDRVQALNRRAVEALRARLQKLQTDLPRLEDRCADDDWTKAAIDLAEHLFWLDESEAWHWLIPRFVESMAYSRELRRGLLQTADRWEEDLSKSGKKRVKVLRAAGDADSSGEEQAGLLDELTRLEGLGWLKGEGESERGAILDWQRGKLLYAREKYIEALAQYERAERGVLENGEALKKHLGEALDDLAHKLMWPQGISDAVYSAEAERILSKVVGWLPEKQGAWYRLGVALRKCGKLLDAIPAYQRAIDLDPKFAAPHHGLGNVYSDLGRSDDAIAAYQRAIDLEPKLAYPHNGLGNVYRDLGRSDEAIAAYQRAIDLDPKLAYPYNGLGTVYFQMGRTDDALAPFQRAIALDPKYTEPHNGLGNVYIHVGRTDDALAAFQRAITLDPKDAAAHSSLASCYRKLGRESEAAGHIKIARELIAKENEYNRACFESICGNTDAALALLEVALEKKQASLEWARRDPDFDFIRADPRFIALVGG